MGESVVQENEIGAHPDWEHILDDDLSLFDRFLLSNSSPDSFSLSISEIENLLMEDDANEDAPGDKVIVDQPPLEFSADFLPDFLLDSPVQSDCSPPNVLDFSDGSNNANSDDKEQEKVDILLEKEDNNKNNNSSNSNSNGDGDDPISKKRRRQLRNRDAAVRSRERKKMYVRDLEMKSRYLEGECQRLGRLLQCCYAENQALRLSLQNAKAYDASRTKQESAVLLLESLLLGSLLWFLGIGCLLILPKQLQLTLAAVPAENVDKKNQGSRAPRKGESKTSGHKVFQSLTVSKRYKASRSRMKPSCSLMVEILVTLEAVV